ncbi:sugar ABC transporter ATP-binding protein [Paenibacillus pini]|uniref:Ribose ABC transport system n=1 Tax=Paenibacillus pini JCM 16418 TaxID=1236976 RepID=W7YN40_9BACL|nr:sugar ABC transporter ATP-binding protein [Paenibacillus pini]GAF09048.1 ribose ABC transport system [Paenibacillus pini JCM 16418]
MSSSFRLEMKSITKQFAGIPALQGVDFSVNGGQIHALLGANGAGKSTLMKILSGAYYPDEGEILAQGKLLELTSPAASKQGGIHCVYQEVDSALVPQLNVVENVMLDSLSAKNSRIWLNPTRMEEKVKSILNRLNVNIDIQSKVSDLSLAEKQMVLIARTLAQDAKVIIFDEPTAPLSESESRSFFRILHGLRDSGVACIFITHRLPEVLEHCDCVTVMRDGRKVHTGDTRETNAEQLIEQMLGKTFEEEFPKVDAEIGEVIFEASNIRRGHQLRGVDIKVRSGEIVAVVGLVGAGKTELARILSGADRMDSGAISMKGKSLKLKQPADAVAAGIVLVPEERRKQGIFIQDSVEHNLSLPVLDLVSRMGFVAARREKERANRLVDALGIKAASGKQALQYLSGGNQQKVAIGKWLESSSDVFIFDEPTKGVDIGAKSDIFRIIGDLAAQGKGILYFTCELAEGLGIGDRIAVMSDGQITKEFKRGEADQAQLLYYASGGTEVTTYEG